MKKYKREDVKQLINDSAQIAVNMFEQYKKRVNSEFNLKPNQLKEKFLLQEYEANENSFNKKWMWFDNTNGLENQILDIINQPTESIIHVLTDTPDLREKLQEKKESVTNSFVEKGNYKSIGFIVRNNILADLKRKYLSNMLNSLSTKKEPQLTKKSNVIGIDVDYDKSEADNRIDSTTIESQLQYFNEFLKGEDTLTDFIKGEIEYERNRLKVANLKGFGNFCRFVRHKIKVLEKLLVENGTPPQQLTKTDKLKVELLKYGFFELSKVKQLSEPNKQSLIELISTNPMPYGIAMFDELEFCDYLDNEQGTKYKANKILSRLYNVNAKDGTSAKHYRRSLFKPLQRYKAGEYKETVKKDYEQLK